MARSFFGGTAQDWLVEGWRLGERTMLSLRLQSTPLTFWADRTSTDPADRYSDLLDENGDAATTISVEGHQIPRFQGPDGVVGMWVDKGDGSPREFIEAQDLAGAAALLVDAAALVSDAEAARDEAVAIVDGVLDSEGLIVPSALPDAVKPGNGAQPVGKGELVFNVLDYGAADDGVTDNRVPFQSAFDAAQAAGGGRVFIPRGSGEYWVSAGAPIRLRSNVWVYSDNATLSKEGGTLFAGYAWAAVTGYGSSVTNVRVSGIRFFGGFPTAAKPAGRIFCPLVWHHASGVIVENCIFDQVQGSAHTMDIQGSENMTIRDNKFIGFHQGSGSAFAECLQVDVSAIGAATTADTVGSYDGLMCRDITITRNQFLPVTVEGTTYPCPNPMGSHTRSEGRYHERVEFSWNTVLDPAHQVSPSDGDNDGYTYGVIHMSTVKGLTIAHNSFKQTVTTRSHRAISVHCISEGGLAGNDPNVAGGATGTWTPVTCDDVKILNNTFEGFAATSTNQQEVIWLNGITSTGYMTRVRVSGNSFSGGWVGVGSDVVKSSAVGCRYVDGLDISGNDFESLNTGLNLTLSHQRRVVGNLFQNIGSLAVYVNAGGTTTVQANSLNDCGRGIMANGVLGGTICGNTINAPKPGGTRVTDTGIEMFGAASRFTIMGNSVYAGTTTLPGPGIDLSASGVTNTSAVGNTVTGYTTKVNIGTVGTRNVAQVNNI